MLRRQREIVTVDPERSVYIATAEDTVLAKLHWYEEGGRACEQQWSDVLGVLRVQAGRLDTEFMRAAALRLAVGDLLDRAFQEAREPRDAGRIDRYV